MQRVKSLVLLAALGGMFLAPAASGQCDPQEIAKLVASDGGSGDYFGDSVSISGGTAIVGASFDDGQRGSAYIFDRVNGVWAQTVKLRASDRASGDRFGFSVAISGDRAVVGAWLDDDLGDGSGSVYFFERAAGVWTQAAKFIGSEPIGNLGYRVAISGDVALAAGVNGVYVIERVGGVWGERALLDGYSIWGGLSVEGDTAILGLPSGGGGNGVAHIVERVAGEWTQTETLAAADGGPGHAFGWRASIDADTAVVAAPGDGTGSAYVFERVGGTWSQTAKLIAADGQAGDLFGHSIALSGDVVIVGAMTNQDLGARSGSAYVFRRSGGSWTQQAKLLASDGAAGDLFGVSVAVDGDTALVSASEDDHSGRIDAGSAYVFGLGCGCAADFNGDHVVDTRDFVSFLNAWAAGDPSADADGNGVIDTRDFIAYLNLWAAGC